MALKNDPRNREQQQPEERPARRGATSQSRIEMGAPIMRRSLRSRYSDDGRDDPTS